MILLVCHAAPAIGLGHLSRLLAVAAALKRQRRDRISLLIFGEPVPRAELADYPHRFVPLENDFAETVLTEAESLDVAAVVFDLHPRGVTPEFSDLSFRLSDLGIRRIGIDSLVPYAENLDLAWFPSFFQPAGIRSGENVDWGWDSYLIQKRLPGKSWMPGKRVLVLTGGSDAAGLGAFLPGLLDTQLPAGAEIDWVRGPYAPPPALPPAPKLNWRLREAPESLDQLIVANDYVLTVFGVSLFEALQYGVPAVVFSPYGRKDDGELAALAREGVAVVSWDAEGAVEDLARLMGDFASSQALSSCARERMAVNGADRLAGCIGAMLARGPNSMASP